jgi:DNA-binding FadR family transcriptional regulator
MRYLECPEYAIELNSITPSSLGTTLANAWLDREQLKEKQQNIVRSISAGARKAAKQLVERYFSES